MVEWFNKAQRVFGRVCELLYIDDDSLEFRCRWWAEGRQFLVQEGEAGNIVVREVIAGIPDETEASVRVYRLLHDYVLTDKDHWVPRSRLAECVAAGH